MESPVSSGLAPRWSIISAIYLWLVTILVFFPIKFKLDIHLRDVLCTPGLGETLLAFDDDDRQCPKGNE
jgi:hypothetical protein